MVNLIRGTSNAVPASDYHPELTQILDRIQHNTSVQRHAALSLICVSQAKEHFIKRVEALPKDQIDAYGQYVAAVLARNTTLTPEGKLEFRGSLTKLANDAKLDWNTFRDRLVKLETCHLILIDEWGKGNGRPSRVRLDFAPQHQQEIIRRAGEEFSRQLEFQNSRSDQTAPNST